MKINLTLDDIKYIKISYKDVSGETHSMKAAIKNVNDREITACTKFEDGLDIETPQEITLSIVNKDGLYKTKTVLKSFENDEPYIFFFISTPDNFEYQQNREYFRVPINMDCTYSVRQYDEIIRIKATTINLSANGICINVPNLIVAEQDAYISFFALNRNIEAKLKYIRSEKTNIGYTASFAFVNLSESDRDLISQVCIKKQLEQKRSSLY